MEIPSFASCATAYCHHKQLAADTAIKYVVQRIKGAPESPAEQQGRFWMQALLNYRLLPPAPEIVRELRVAYNPNTGEIHDLPGDALIPAGWDWREDHYLCPTQWTVPAYHAGGRTYPRTHPLLDGPDVGPYRLIYSENGVSCGCRRAHEAGHTETEDGASAVEGPCTHKAALDLLHLLAGVDRTVTTEGTISPPTAAEIDSAYQELLINLCVSTVAPPIPPRLLPAIAAQPGAAEQIYRVLWLLDQDSPLRLDETPGPDPDLGARLGAALAHLTAEIAEQVGPVGAAEIAVQVYAAEAAEAAARRQIDHVQQALAEGRIVLPHAPIPAPAPVFDDQVDSIRIAARALGKTSQTFHQHVAAAIREAHEEHGRRAREAGETPYRTALRDVWGQ